MAAEKYIGLSAYCYCGGFGAGLRQLKQGEFKLADTFCVSRFTEGKSFMSDWQPVVNLLLSIPVALLTSWLTVKFALRRFQSEKWFERRIDAYTKVIEALHFMKHCTERQLRAGERGTDIPKEIEDELVGAYRKGLSDLRRFTDMGALLFSPEAVAILDALNSELLSAANEEDYWAHLEVEEAAISKCLAELRPIAKRDLNA